MALKTLAPRPFLVFPTRTNIYRWEIWDTRDTRDGSRPISRHKYLSFAMLEADRLNKVAQEQESKIVTVPLGPDAQALWMLSLI